MMPFSLVYGRDIAAPDATLPHENDADETDAKVFTQGAEAWQLAWSQITEQQDCGARQYNFWHRLVSHIFWV